MHILVTNDDGVYAPGLLALVQAMRPLGKVTILAPDKNWSASGHVKTLNRPIRIRETTLSDGTPALASDGAPSDCVALALLGHVEKVDIVVSGINPHGNFGHDVTYSGTVTAAMEAVIAGIPGLAFSLETPHGESSPDYAPATEIARKVTAQVLQRGLPKGVLLNVNIPYLPLDSIRGIEITRQGMRIYRDKLISRVDPQGRPYYWIGGDPASRIAEEGTDFGALAEGYVSITPLHLDLTAYEAMDTLRAWTFGES